MTNRHRQADGGLDIDLAKLAGSKAAVAAALAQRGPFDGLMGFSQGAALAAALVADQQAGRALSDVPRLR